MLGRVVSKLITDVSEVILIAPMWKRDQQWWQDIQPYVKRRCYFKTGHHLFEVEGKSQPLKWPVEAYWVDVMGYWFEHQRASQDALSALPEPEPPANLPETDTWDPPEEGPPNGDPPRRFQFMRDLPTEEQNAIRQSQTNRPRSQTRASQPVEPTRDELNMAMKREFADSDPQHILQTNWASHYESDEYFGDVWRQAHDPDVREWPKGIQIYHDKMYLNQRLCVPADIADIVMAAHHLVSGHCGTNKLMKSLSTRYEFASDFPIEDMAKGVRAGCLVCQVAEPSTRRARGIIEMNLVPDKIMSHVCLDVFSLPPTVLRGKPMTR